MTHVDFLTRIKNFYTCQKLDFDQVSHLTPIFTLFLEIFSHFRLFRLARDARPAAVAAPLASAFSSPPVRPLSSDSLISHFSNAACQAAFVADARIDFGLKPNIFTHVQNLYTCQKIIR